MIMLTWLSDESSLSIKGGFGKVVLGWMTVLVTINGVHDLSWT